MITRELNKDVVIEMLLYGYSTGLRKWDNASEEKAKEFYSLWLEIIQELLQETLEESVR